MLDTVLNSRLDKTCRYTRIGRVSAPTATAFLGNPLLKFYGSVSGRT